MTDSSRHDAWQAGSKYDAYMGRWSRQIAPVFLDWLAAPMAADWLDVGCGTGSLSAAILAEAAPASVTGIDASEGFVGHAAAKITDPRASFRQGDAQAISMPDASCNAVVSGLVLNFVPDRQAMLSEMARVLKPGGALGFFVWDYPGSGMGFMRAFWRAAAALDPDAAALTESHRFPDCTEAGLGRLASGVWARRVETTALVIPTVFQDFEDYWHPFTLGAGPAPGYCASLPEDRRENLRRKLAAELPRQADGSIALTARAWGVKAVVK